MPILGDGASDGILNDAGATGVDNIANLANNPYLANNTYRDLADDDDNDKDDNDNDGDDDIEILSKPAPTAAAKLIIGINKESTGVADK